MKLTKVLLCLALALACALPAAADATPKGAFPIAEGEVTLTIAMPVPAQVEDIYTNKMTLWLEEQTGVKLEFVALSASDTATQVNTMMTSGKLPDIFLGYRFSYEQLCSYADAGYIIPLDGLIAEYGDAYFAAMDSLAAKYGISDAPKYARYEGSVWAIPTCTPLITSIYGPHAMWIQSQFLEALNMEMPETLDEFREYLRAVRDSDANGNGDSSDEIPLTTSAEHNDIFRVISQAYQYTDLNTYLKINEGAIEFIAGNDLYKEAVEYARSMVEEGLIDPASWTQDMATLSSIINSTDTPVLGAVGTGHYFTSYYDTTKDKFKSLRTPGNLEGPYGYSATMVEIPSVGCSLAITSSCANPEIAFRFLDFVMSEEASVVARIGFQGEQYEPAAEGAVGRNGESALYQLISTQEVILPSTNVIWGALSTGMTLNDRMNYVVSSESDVAYWLSVAIAEKKLVESDTHEQTPQLLMSVDDSSEYTELNKQIVDYVNEKTSMFILGYLPMSDWDAYLAEFDALGVSRYVELAQTAYDAMNG